MLLKFIRKSVFSSLMNLSWAFPSKNPGLIIPEMLLGYILQFLYDTTEFCIQRIFQESDFFPKNPFGILPNSYRKFVLVSFGKPFKIIIVVSLISLWVFQKSSWDLLLDYPRNSFRIFMQILPSFFRKIFLDFCRKWFYDCFPEELNSLKKILDSSEYLLNFFPGIFRYL